MKKLFESAITVLLVITFASVVLAETNPIPAQAQQALDKALADPPLSYIFLCEVYGYQQVAQYMAHAPIVLDLGTVKMYFSASSGITLVKEKCSIQIEAPLEEGSLSDCFAIEDRAESACCSEMRMELGRYRQSDFWSAFATAVAP